MLLSLWIYVVIQDENTILLKSYMTVCKQNRMYFQGKENCAIIQNTSHILLRLKFCIEEKKNNEGDLFLL